MPSTIASVTDLIIDDFNSATEFGEFTIPKLTDATSPKLSDDAARMSTDSLIPNDGDDLVFDSSGANGSSPDRFPTETVKMTYGAIEWSYAPGRLVPGRRPRCRPAGAGPSSALTARAGARIVCL
jgi:hypothetical protein